MGKIKIPYYVVVNGYGYWRPKAEAEALGFQRVRCGRDGPAAWAVAKTWASRLEQARLGEYAPPRQKYAAGVVGDAFERFRRTDEWARKAPRTREEWERVWRRLEPILGDMRPSTISMEDIGAIRQEIEREVSLREAHRVVKIWRALWKIMAAMGYCAREADPSLGIRNRAAPPRQDSWREGETVMLAKGAWRARFFGLSALIAAAWDTQLSPVDVRRLTASQSSRNGPCATFALPRAKTGRAALATLSARATAVLDAYVAALGFELHGNAPIFRNRSGAPYSKDTLGDDFRTVRTIVFGAPETRTLADFRRSGAIEAIAGGADAATLSAKMANTLSVSNDLHRTYVPVEISKVRAADAARRAGRTKLRNEKRS